MKNIFFLFVAFTYLSCTKKEVRNTEVHAIPADSVSKTTHNTGIPDFSKTEEMLVGMLQQVSGPGSQEQDASLLNRQFFDSLATFIKSNENTLQYPFELLQKEHVYITTSADKQLRIYSWDNNQGGTMRFFDQLFQFRSNARTYVKEHIASEDSQAFFSKIYTVQNNVKQPVYLAISNSILSSRYIVQHITAYQIKDGVLEEAKIFKTKKELLSGISVEFDFGSVADRPERPVEVISLNTNELRVSLVDKALSVTKQNLIYEWDGSVFNYKGIQ